VALSCHNFAKNPSRPFYLSLLFETLVQAIDGSSVIRAGTFGLRPHGTRSDWTRASARDRPDTLIFLMTSCSTFRDATDRFAQ
jgi:hypothetical protein